MGKLILKVIVCIIFTQTHAFHVLAQSNNSFTGIWGFLNAEDDVLNAKNSNDHFYKDWLKGTLIAVEWRDIQPQINSFDFTSVEEKLNAAAQADIRHSMLVIYHGGMAPHWIYGEQAIPKNFGNKFTPSPEADHYPDPDYENADGIVPLIGEFPERPHERYYPDYLDMDYRIFHDNMVREVNSFLTQWKLTAAGQKLNITAIQATTGKSGDPNAYFRNTELIYKGQWRYPELSKDGKTYLRYITSMTDPRWKKWTEDLYHLYVDTYQLYLDEPPLTKVQFNTHVLLEDAFENVLNRAVNPPKQHNLLDKFMDIHQGYQLTDEAEPVRLFENVSKKAGRFMTRGELGEPIKNGGVSYYSGPYDPGDTGIRKEHYWHKKPEQNLYWSILWMLHMGLDIYNIRDLQDFRQLKTSDPEYYSQVIDIFNFFSLRAGYKNPKLESPGSSVTLSEQASRKDKPYLSTHAFIAFREGLDFKDSTYVPYGGQDISKKGDIH